MTNYSIFIFVVTGVLGFVTGIIIATMLTVRQYRAATRMYIDASGNYEASTRMMNEMSDKLRRVRAWHDTQALDHACSASRGGTDS